MFTLRTGSYFQVVILQSHQEAEECLFINLESLEEVPVLEYLVGGGGEHPLVLDIPLQGEHVQTPGAHVWQLQH